MPRLRTVVEDPGDPADSPFKLLLLKDDLATLDDTQLLQVPLPPPPATASSSKAKSKSKKRKAAGDVAPGEHRPPEAEAAGEEGVTCATATAPAPGPTPAPCTLGELVVQEGLQVSAYDLLVDYSYWSAAHVLKVVPRCYFVVQGGGGVGQLVYGVKVAGRGCGKWAL